MTKIADVHDIIEEIIHEKTLSLDGIKSLSVIKDNHDRILIELDDAIENANSLKETITARNNEIDERKKEIICLKNDLESQEEQIKSSFYTELRTSNNHYQTRGNEFKEILSWVFKNNIIRKNICETVHTPRYDEYGSEQYPKKETTIDRTETINNEE